MVETDEQVDTYTSTWLVLRQREGQARNSGPRGQGRLPGGDDA